MASVSLERKQALKIFKGSYMKKRNDGFTLVELLVVISIIALLLSVLMPSLSKVRKNARRLICGTNLHNLSTTMTVYHNSYNSYPACTWEPSGSTDMNLRTYWWEALIKGGAIEGKNDGYGNWAVAKSGGWKAYSCPEFLSLTKAKYSWAGQGYAYNMYLSPTYGNNLPNPDYLGKNPKGNIIVLIDAGTNTTHVPFISSTKEFFPYDPKIPAWKTNGIIAIWHDISKKESLAPSAWTDGHVEARNVKEYTPVMVDPLVDSRPR